MGNKKIVVLSRFEAGNEISYRFAQSQEPNVIGIGQGRGPVG